MVAYSHLFELIVSDDLRLKHSSNINILKFNQL